MNSIFLFVINLDSYDQTIVHKLNIKQYMYLRIYEISFAMVAHVHTYHVLVTQITPLIMYTVHLTTPGSSLKTVILCANCTWPLR